MRSDTSKSHDKAMEGRRVTIPLSKNDIKYVRDKMGSNRKSIFHHKLRSCSGDKSGGRGNVESPPKSAKVPLVREEISNTPSGSFSSDMTRVRSQEGGGINGTRVNKCDSLSRLV